MDSLQVLAFLSPWIPLGLLHSTSRWTNCNNGSWAILQKCRRAEEGSRALQRHLTEEYLSKSFYFFQLGFFFSCFWWVGGISVEKNPGWFMHMKNISLGECVSVASYKVNWLFHVAFWHVRSLLLSNSAALKSIWRTYFWVVSYT